MELEEICYLTRNVVFSYQTEAFGRKDKSFRLERYTADKAVMVEQVLTYVRELAGQRIRLIGLRCSSIIRADELRKMQIDKYLGDKGEKNDEGPVMEYFCPICSKDISCAGNLAAFNRHIDKCMEEGKLEEE